MMQTTLIGGLGLAVFATSTFTPTQQFGYLMITAGYMAYPFATSVVMLTAFRAIFAVGAAAIGQELRSPHLLVAVFLEGADLLDGESGVERQGASLQIQLSGHGLIRTRGLATGPVFMPDGTHSWRWGC